MAGAVAMRKGRPEDIERVLELWRQAEATPSATDTRESLTRLLAEPTAVLLVAEADGRVVGTVIGGWDGWRGNIYRLAVLPEYRRRGIAGALMREVDAVLAGLGARRITALVEGDHPWATDFWDSLATSGYRYDEGMRRYVKTF